MGKQVLLCDESEEEEILSRLPLPDKLPDCLFYQEVDYRIRPGAGEGRYDVQLRYSKDTRACPPDVVLSGWDRVCLANAVSVAAANDAPLVVCGLPDRRPAGRLLEVLPECLPSAQLLELPLRVRDVQAFLDEEYGRKNSVRQLSRECIRLFRYLAERFAGEVDADDCRLLE